MYVCMCVYIYIYIYICVNKELQIKKKGNKISAPWSATRS